MRHVCSSSALIALLMLTACASEKVLVPARVDLGAYPTVGIVVFSSNTRGNLEEYATQKFMQTVQAAQPGVRILELGSEEHVLAAIEHDTLDFEAVRAIGEKWGVEAVFTGHLDVTGVKPRLELATMIKTLSLQADVEASLQARLIEADHGATVWTRSSRGEAPVAHVKLVARGPFDFGASDPEKAYGKLVQRLVSRVSHDFYSHWERP